MKIKKERNHNEAKCMDCMNPCSFKYSFETEIDDEDIFEDKSWREIIEEAENEEEYFDPVELEPGVWLY